MGASWGHNVGLRSNITTMPDWQASSLSLFFRVAFSAQATNDTSDVHEG